MASDELPVGNTSSPLRPRFPGDRGRGADIPLESMPKPADNPPGTFDVLDVFPPQGPSRSLKEKPMPPAGIKQISDSGPLTLSGDDLEKGYLQSISGDDLEKNYKPTNPLAPTVDMKTGLPKNWFQQARENVGQVPYVGPLASGIMGIKPASPAMAMPPGASVLGRAGLNAAGGGIEAALEGKGPLGIAKAAGTNAALGAIIGEPLAALGKLIPMTKSANVLRQGAEDKLAHDTALTGALNATEKTAYDAAKSAHASQVSDALAKNLEQNVPALKGVKGLYDMVYGKGRELVKDAFAKSLETIKQNAAGKTVELPNEVASKLGYEVSNPLGGMDPKIVEVLRASGRLPRDVGTAGKTAVDAADLAEKLLGFGKKEPRGYREAVDALDAAGIGDPAARSAYRYYQGLTNYIDKSKSFKGEQFMPDKFLEGASQLKNIDELRRRGMGSATQGPLTLAQGGPKAPTPRTVPVQPELPEIRSYQNPLAGHPFLGAIAGGSLGHMLGMGGIGHAVGGLAGAGVSNAMPKEIVTRAPIAQGTLNGINATPGALATLIRAITGAGSTGQ